MRLTDALRDAELLANAIHAGLDGTSMTGALSDYQPRARRVSHTTSSRPPSRIASLDWTEDSLLEIFMRFGAAVSTEAEGIAAFG